MSNIKIACIGECMIELTTGDTPNNLIKNYAGDTYNTAYYLKKLLNNQADVSYITAVGTDALSHKLIDALNAADLNTRSIRCLEDGKVGLYLVANDDDGERHFTYWRETSSAKRMFDGDEGDALLASLSDYQMVYLSGISLAILTPVARMKLVNALKAAQVDVVFDPNYRPKLWQSASEASSSMQDLVSTTHATVMTTLDDEQLLNDLHTDIDVVSFWQQAGAQEVIVKKGAEGCLIASEEQLIPSLAGISPLDTTGAGDSFNGGYLAGLALGKSKADSAKLAHNIAAQVIQHRGAIVPENLLNLA
ncbi:sugar kinase [Marinomonas atlantica]|uniref:sugar kinase n=1 Tax=Marinomonas atlantica TaxID=1806668 RepID=UPI00082E5045|nr:sugar kinase [Marinomonas atlantica]MCO4785719.1 sugar kinase [Marinomonas atlantica]